MEFHPQLTPEQASTLSDLGLDLDAEPEKICSVGPYPGANPKKLPLLEINPGSLVDMNEIVSIYCGLTQKADIWEKPGETIKEMQPYRFTSNSPFYDQFDCILDPNMIIQPDRVDSARSILVNGDHLISLLDILHASETDHTLTIIGRASEFTALRRLALPPTTVAIKAQSCAVSAPDTTPIPLGPVMRPSSETPKSILCYYVPMMPPAPINRATSKNCTNAMTKKKGDWLVIEDGKVYEETLKKSSFLVCPPLLGLDTPLFWEAKAHGVIPIVIDSPLAPMYKMFGCLVVSRWEDITEELLRSHRPQ